MFGWLKRKPALPLLSPTNPGQGSWIRMAFSNGDRSWSEDADALDLLAEVLKNRSLPCVRGKERLQLDNGLILRPEFVHLQPRDDGLVRTVTTVEVNHPDLCPEGTFEYHHSVDQTTGHSMARRIEKSDHGP